MEVLNSMMGSQQKYGVISENMQEQEFQPGNQQNVVISAADALLAVLIPDN